MKATKQQLIEAKALIQDKSKWTRDAYARDRLGQGVWPDNEAATCFCALGALMRITGAPARVPLDEMAECVEPLNTAALKLGHSNAACLNDRNVFGHERVMLMYKLAIEEAPE